MLGSNSKIRDYIDVFFQRKQLFIIPLISISILSIILAFFISPFYRTTVNIEIVSNIPLTPDTNEAISKKVDEQFGILKERVFSYPTLKEIIEKADLDKGPLLIKESIDDLNKKLTIEKTGDYLISIMYDNEDADLATKIAKIATNTFVKESFKIQKIPTSKPIKSKRDLTFQQLKDRLKELEEKLDELLVDNRENHPLVVDTREAIEETKGELKGLAEGQSVSQQATDIIPSKADLVLEYKVVKPDNIEAVKNLTINRNVIILGILAGIIVGIGLVLLAEAEDHSFKGLDDSRDFLTLPVFGAIPKRFLKNS